MISDQVSDLVKYMKDFSSNYWYFRRQIPHFADPHCLYLHPAGQFRCLRYQTTKSWNNGTLHTLFSYCIVCLCDKVSKGAAATAITNSWGWKPPPEVIYSLHSLLHIEGGVQAKESEWQVLPRDYAIYKRCVHPPPYATSWRASGSGSTSTLRGPSPEKRHKRRFWVTSDTMADPSHSRIFHSTSFWELY
jgi:hypothetical protein